MLNPFATPSAAAKGKATAIHNVHQHAKPRFARTWRDLHAALESIDLASQQEMANFLDAEYEHYKLLLDMFTPPNPASKAQILAAVASDATPIILDGATAKVIQEEAQFAFGVSALLKLDEISALAMVRSYVRSEIDGAHGSIRPGVKTSTVKYNDELMEKVAELYFDERLEVLAVVAGLVKASQNDSHVHHATALETVERLVDDKILGRVLTQFKMSTEAKLSEQVESIPKRTAMWTRQALKEQKGLLHILVYLFYNPPEPQDAVKTIEVFTDLHFGRKQACSQLFDDAGSKLLHQVCELCVVISIEVMDLEEVLNLGVTGEDVFAAPQNDTLISTPAALVQITRLLQNAANPLARESQSKMFANDAAPVLLAWAAYGFHIAEPIKASASYQTLVDVMTAKRPNGPNEDTTLVPSIFFNIATHANALQYLVDLLKGPLCQDEGLEYRCVIKGMLMLLLVAVPDSIRPHLEIMLEAMSAIVAGIPDLCKQFWEEDYRFEDRRDMIDWPRSRFPFTASPVIKFLTALASSNLTATYVYRYFRTLPTFTASVDDRVLVYDPFMTNQRGFNQVKLGQPLPTTPFASSALNIVIPAGTMGYRLSVTSDLQVQFQYELSGWHWCISVIDSYLHTPDRDLDSETIELVRSIIDLMSAMFAAGNGGSLSDKLMEHLCQFPAQGPSLTPNDLVTFVCRILSRSCVSNKPSPDLITSSLKCIVQLLPHYPDAVWNHLRQDPFMPRYSSVGSMPSSGFVQAVVLPQEKQEGKYSTTIAFLDLVSELTSHSRKLNGMTTRQVELVTACVHFIRTDIYSTYASWRYAKALHKYEIGARVVSIFSLILRDVTYVRGYATKTSNNGNCDLSRIYQQLADTFLNDGEGRVTRPLLNIIQGGHQLVFNIYHRMRLREGNAVRILIRESLNLLVTLLRLRVNVSQQRQVTALSPLELYLLDKTGRGTSTDTVRQLGLYSRYFIDSELPSLAIQALTLLCVATKSIESGQSSFLGYFGMDAPHISAALVQFLGDDFYGPEIQVPIWDFITAVVQSQPALSSLLLKAEASKFEPSPNQVLDGTSSVFGSSRRAEPTTDEFTVKENTAIFALLFVLQNWKSFLKRRPLVVVAASAFMESLWQDGAKYKGLLNKLRQRQFDEFWHPLTELLKHRPTPMVEGVQIATLQRVGSRWVSAEDASVKRHAASILVKSYIVRTLSRDLQLTPLNIPQQVSAILISTYGARPLVTPHHPINRGSDKEERPPILQPPAAPVNLTIPLPFETFAFDPELQSQLLHEANHYPNHSINLTAVRFLTWHPELDAQWQPGDSYMFDLDLLDAKLTASEAKNDFLGRLCVANHNWSVTDAQLTLLKSWSNLIKLATIRLPALFGETDESRMQVLSRSVYDMSRKTLEYSGSEYPYVIYRTIMSQTMLALVDSWSELTYTKLSSMKSPLPGADAKLIRSMHQQMVEILDQLSQVWASVENGAGSVLDVEDGYGLRLQTILLSSILRAVQALTDVTRLIKLDARHASRAEVILNGLMTMACNNSSALLAGLVAEKDTGKDLDASHTKELNLTLSLVSELVRHLQNNPTVMVTILERCQVIPKLLQALVVILSCPADQQPVGIETILCCLSTLSQCPPAAERLAGHGVLAAFTNNAFTPRLEEGSVRPYTGARLNLWHQTWLSMLTIMAECVMHLSESLDFVQSVAVFANHYRAQFAHALAPGGPNDQITLANVQETRHVVRFFWALTVYSVDLRRVATEAMQARSRDAQSLAMVKTIVDQYQQAVLELLPTVLWRFNHRKLVASHTVAISVEESEKDAQDAAIPNLPIRQLVNDVYNEYVLISYYAISALAASTDTTSVLYSIDSQAEWDYSKQVIPPDLIDGSNGVGIGTFMEILAVLMEYKVNEGNLGGECQRAGVLTQGLALIATQLALFMYSPDYPPDLKRHTQSLIFTDLGRCIDTVKNRIRLSYQAAVSEDVRKELKGETAIVEAVERFVKERVFLTE
ncbi:hypothetical protein SmJEL517_g00327 [Synchytrium microbalum]|uniref:Nucleoporin NUP188 n=1 Tax=Synchytrium microbalum TaxID=1806994 RepID=A0A507CJE9_9FUNG|nr:uncharacterized protein SmJEL517_g00327 [Synchytrium microbalum]TPX38334.1 hypothetical protein SmJEL517_g00327 [Synchytrium microbalum]